MNTIESKMSGPTARIEFAVQMTCDSCVEDIKKSLEGVPGIKNVEVNLQAGSVVVDTTMSTEDVHKKLKSTGRKAVVRGFDGSLAGVAVLETGSENVQGVVRFVQTDPNTCIIDGTVDGLKPGEHNLCIHECGDISNGCESVGECFDLSDEHKRADRVYGNIGKIVASNDGRAAFRLEDNVIKLSDIIGRSLVISDSSKKRIVCGIIARSSGLFQNPKTICACDGVSIWDERAKPRSVL